MLPKQNVLTVVLVDRWTTTCELEHLGEYHPSEKRTVHIPLTASQMEALRLREVGTRGGEAVYEEIDSVWLEERRESED